MPKLHFPKKMLHKTHSAAPPSSRRHHVETVVLGWPIGPLTYQMELKTVLEAACGLHGEAKASQTTSLQW